MDVSDQRKEEGKEKPTTTTTTTTTTMKNSGSNREKEGKKLKEAPDVDNSVWSETHYLVVGDSRCEYLNVRTDGSSLCSTPAFLINTAGLLPVCSRE